MLREIRMHNRQLTGIANYWVIRPFRIYSTVIVLVAVQINYLSFISYIQKVRQNYSIFVN